MNPCHKLWTIKIIIMTSASSNFGTIFAKSVKQQKRVVQGHNLSRLVQSFLAWYHPTNKKRKKWKNYQNFVENCKERLTSLSGLVFKKMLTMNALPENRTEFANLVSLKFHHCADACRRCPEGFGGKYSEFKSRGTQIFRIFPPSPSSAKFLGWNNFSVCLEGCIIFRSCEFSA